MALLTQKALILDAKLGKFSVDIVQVPKPGIGEILIKVKAAALKPVDWKIYENGFLVEKLHLPAILGTDIAGDVVEIGEDVTEFQKGDRVLVKQIQFKNEYGGYQQYALAFASEVAKIPSNTSYDEAATLPVDKKPSQFKMGINGGNPIIIIEGFTSIGQNAIQLAKLSGFSPVITTASLKHAEFLKSIGATHVIDRSISVSALVSEINGITQHVSIKYAVDSISLPDMQQAAYDLLGQGGRLVIFPPPAVKTAQENDVVSVNEMLRGPPNIELLEIFYHDNLERSLRERALKPNQVQVEIVPNGLAGIPEGLNRLEAGEVSRSKLVAHPQDTA